MVYNDYSNDAATIIQHGMTELKNLLTAGKFAGLQEQLHLCSAPDSTNQTHDVLAAVLKAYLINAEENSWHNNYPLYATINATLAANTSLAAVGAAVSIYNAVEGQKCLNFDPGYANGGPFMWLRCTQIPYPQSWSAAGSIWGLIAPIVDPTRNQTRLLDPYCQAAFGINSTGGGDGLQRQLGLDQDTLAATQRLLVTEGLLDPTTGLGPSSWYPGTSRNHSRIIYVGESAHTEVMNPPSPKDSDALVEARIFVLNSIKQWLGL
ncbi:hypothetical protein LTR47_002556 [Exophiala xenobiotica]|nr:hypothetical protein LTR47_002556 [Exophiala xenobiotica]